MVGNDDKKGWVYFFYVTQKPHITVQQQYEYENTKRIVPFIIIFVI